MVRPRRNVESCALSPNGVSVLLGTRLPERLEW
jgi:hypothetical protein